MFPNLGTEIHPLLFKIKSQINQELNLNSHWSQQMEERKNKCTGKKKKENMQKYVFN